MNLYKNHTNREVVAVLEQSTKLTYDAQLNLLQELKARGLPVATNVLENHIQEKEEAIHSLAYLKDLGFKYEEEIGSKAVKVTRATKAKVMDVVSIVLGAILFLVGLVYFWMLMAIFFGDNEFTLSKLFTHCLMIAAGMIGFKMLSGIHRFLDYFSFSLVQSGTLVSVDKGGVKGTQKIPVSDLKIVPEEGDLVLYAGAIEIMRCTEDNLVHKRTLESLLQKMIENQ